MHVLEKEMATHSSILGEPQDGGAWWAAVHGVAQSHTRLKQLSSSSSILHMGKLRLRENRLANVTQL